MGSPVLISLIVPVYQEPSLGRFMESLGSVLDASTVSTLVSPLESSHCLFELIVVNGGSEIVYDESLVMAHAVERFTRVVMAVCEPGRARQLRLGGQLAKGEVLVFLHTDTCLPVGFSQMMLETVESGYLAGSFSLAFESSSRYFRWLAWCATMRSRLTRIPFGDQVLFFDAAFYYSIGGFPECPFMEDLVMMHQIRRLGVSIRILDAAVITSHRRYERYGRYRVTALNVVVQVLWKLGVPLKTLSRLYQVGLNV